MSELYHATYMSSSRDKAPQMCWASCLHIATSHDRLTHASHCSMSAFETKCCRALSTAFDMFAMQSEAGTLHERQATAVLHWLV